MSEELNGAAAPKQPRGRQFEKGNPGRPRGARNKRTVALEAILEGHAEGLTTKLVELALAGDASLLKACVDRILGKSTSRMVTLDLPKIECSDDAAKAIAAVVAAVAAGDVTPSEGMEMARLISVAAKAFDVEWEILK